MTALLLYIAAAQDLGDWLDRLSDPEIEVRERAELEIRKMGKKVVPDLRKVAETHGDPEVRGRARALLRWFTQVRWRRDVAEALRAAAAERKPVFVFSTMGPPDGYL